MMPSGLIAFINGGLDAAAIVAVLTTLASLIG
jgi:hypothetical protein